MKLWKLQNGSVAFLLVCFWLGGTLYSGLLRFLYQNDVGFFGIASNSPATTVERPINITKYRLSCWNHLPKASWQALTSEVLRACREREVRVDIEVKKALDQSNTIAERTVSQTQALKTISKILDVSAGWISSFLL